MKKHTLKQHKWKKEVDFVRIVFSSNHPLELILIKCKYEIMLQAGSFTSTWSSSRELIKELKQKR